MDTAPPTSNGCNEAEQELIQRALARMMEERGWTRDVSWKSLSNLSRITNTDLATAANLILDGQPLSCIPGRTADEDKVIAHAKSLLITNRQYSEPDAYNWLRKQAMDRQVRLLDVAKEVIDGAGGEARG